MKSSFLKILLAIMLMMPALLASARDEGDHISGDIQLRGLLGEKLKIEMQLNCNHTTSFFSNQGAECLDIEGSYAYQTQYKPIALKGRVCPANGTFFLKAMIDGSEKERFEGKWNPALKQLSGTWTLLQTNKTMPFSLTAVDGGYAPDQFTGFFKLIREQMQGEPDAEGASIADAQWMGKYGKISGFAPNWGGDVRFLSPTRFEYSTSYNSTARSSDYDQVYQLLQSNSGTYILFGYSSFNYDKMTAEESGSEDEASSYSYELSVYHLVDGEFKEMGAAAWPDAKVNHADSGTDGLTSSDVEVWSTGLRLPSGEKLTWAESKFVR